MDKLVIHGGKKISGIVAASGSKNSALPVIAATLLTPKGSFTIDRIPDLKDVRTFIQLLDYLGAQTSFDNNRLQVDSSHLKSIEAQYELVKKMRAAIYVLGPLLARFGHTRVSLPGGCAFGPRPVDLHIMAMEKLGATVTIEQGFIDARVNGSRLSGAHIDFPISSVGATGNALMAAVTAEGTTVLENAALEPEIECLCRFLKKMGAQIDGIGTTTLTIEGVETLEAVEFANIFDRIEAGTLLCAAAITGGCVTVTETVPEHLNSVLEAFRQANCTVTVEGNAITLAAPDQLQAVDITARPYPEFPTDMQAQWMALMTQAHGNSTIIDRVYLERFNHLPELNRLGANIELRDSWALVHGPQELTGTKVMSTDLRASASLVLAGLIARQTTEVLRVYHLDRGYEAIENKLTALGADIKREQYQEFS